MRDHTNCNHCYCIKEGDPNSTSVSPVHVSCCKCGDRIASSLQKWQSDANQKISQARAV